MNRTSWIKNALEKEAKPSWIKSESFVQTFVVLDECVSVDFSTKPDEIPIIISDVSGLQMFAICSIAQKLKILSDKKTLAMRSKRRNSSAENLKELHLWCLEYKLELRKNINIERNGNIDDICMPGVDYQIVILLIAVEEIDAEDPFLVQEKQIEKLCLRFWYYECNECRIFANIIKENLMASTAKKHTDQGVTHKGQQNLPLRGIPETQEPGWTDSGTMTKSQYTPNETHKVQQNLPLRSTRESQEPDWTDTSTVGYSQFTQNIPQRLLPGKPIAKKMDVHPPCRITKTSGQMENRRLNELMNTSKPSIDLNTDLIDKAPREDSSPGITMNTEELLDIVQSKLPCTDTKQDDMNSTQGLSSTVNLNKTLSPSTESRVDLTLSVETCASLMLTTDKDINLSPIAAPCNDIVRTIENKGCENFENVIMDQEKDHVDNSETVHTILDHAKPIELDSLPDVGLVDGITSVDVLLKNVAVDINQKNTEKTAEEDIVDQGNDRDSDINRANLVNTDQEGVSNVNLDQLNLADHLDHKANVTLANSARPSNITQTLPALRDEGQKPGFPLDQPMHGNPTDQSSHRRKIKRMKKIHGTVMYPIPNPNYSEEFDKYVCTNTFFILNTTGSNSDGSSDHDMQDDLDKARKKSTRKECGHVITAVSNPVVLQKNKHPNGLPHIASTNRQQQNKNKLYTSPVINEEFRNGLLQHLTCSSSGSDKNESATEVEDTSRKATEMSKELFSRKRYIHGNHKPKDLLISPDFRNALLKYMSRDV